MGTKAKKPRPKPAEFWEAAVRGGEKAVRVFELLAQARAEAAALFVGVPWWNTAGPDLRAFCEDQGTDCPAHLLADIARPAGCLETNIVGHATEWVEWTKQRARQWEAAG